MPGDSSQRCNDRRLAVRLAFIRWLARAYWPTRLTAFEFVAVSSRLLKNPSGSRVCVIPCVQHGGGGDAWQRRGCGLFVQLSRPGEAHPAGPSAAGDPRDRQRDAGDALARIRRALRVGRAGLDPAGAAFARVAVAGVLLDPLGAPAGRADRVRHAVPLVRGPWRRRPGVGRHDVHQEPRPAAGRRRGGQVPGRRAGPPPRQGAALDRALLGRRHAAGAWASAKSFRPKGGARDGSGPPDAGMGATASKTSAAGGAPTTRTRRPPTRTRGFTARAGARRQGSASWATR